MGVLVGALMFTWLVRGKARVYGKRSRAAGLGLGRGWLGRWLAGCKQVILVVSNASSLRRVKSRVSEATTLEPLSIGSLFKVCDDVGVTPAQLLLNLVSPRLATGFLMVIESYNSTYLGLGQ